MGGLVGGNLEVIIYIFIVEDVVGNLINDIIEIGELVCILVIDIVFGDVSCVSFCDGFVDIMFVGGMG